MSKNAKKPTLNDILDLAIELARRHADASVQNLYYCWSKDFSMRGSEKRWAVKDAEPAGLERRCHLGSTVNSRLFGMSVEKSTLADQVTQMQVLGDQGNVTEMHRARVRL